MGHQALALYNFYHPVTWLEKGVFCGILFRERNIFFKGSNSEARKMDQKLTCLPHKHEDWSSDTQNSCRYWVGMATHL